eukprot:scaffold11809_cov128-Cylindrotheca_fusiformis.AAC.7
MTQETATPTTEATLGRFRASRSPGAVPSNNENYTNTANAPGADIRILSTALPSYSNNQPFATS